MSINLFQQFIKENGFDKNHFQKPQLQKVSILTQENKWILHIGFQNLLFINDLSSFLEKLKFFLEEKCQNHHLSKENIILIEYRLHFQNFDYLPSLAQSYYRYIISQTKFYQKYLDLEFFENVDYQLQFKNEKFIIFVNPKYNLFFNKKIKLLKEFFSYFYSFKNDFVLEKDDKIKIKQNKEQKISLLSPKESQKIKKMTTKTLLKKILTWDLKIGKIIS